MNCPHCDRLLYSRQHPRCGYCGEPLPEEMRLEPHEIVEIKAEIREIDARRAKSKEKEEEDREAARRRNDGGVGGCGLRTGFDPGFGRARACRPGIRLPSRLADDRNDRPDPSPRSL